MKVTFIFILYLPDVIEGRHSRHADFPRSASAGLKKYAEPSLLPRGPIRKISADQVVVRAGGFTR